MESDSNPCALSPDSHLKSTSLIPQLWYWTWTFKCNSHPSRIKKYRHTQTTRTRITSTN